MTTLITALSVKNKILIVSWISIAAGTNLKEIVTCVVAPGNNACDSTRLMKLEVDDRKMQV